MVDLKEIPHELSVLLKTYSQIGSTNNNLLAYLDMNYLDISLIPNLEEYFYKYTQELIKTKYKGDIIRQDIEKYLKDTLNLTFSQLYLWDGKVMYE